METVLIFEDDLVIQRGINQLVWQAFFKAGKQVSLLNCATLEEGRRRMTEAKVDLFLLDVAIPENPRAGIELGVHIVSQDRYQNTPIIYITANPNTVFEAVNKTHCYQFLEKPFFEADLIQAVSQAIQSNKSPHTATVTLTSMGKEYTLCRDDILYLETMGHHVTVWTKDDALVLKNVSLCSLLKHLTSPFVQCHKSFAVNRDYIKLVDYPKNTLYLKDGKNIPLGRAFKKQL